MKIRTGFGYDVHQMVGDRPFWLGGIKLEFEKGAVGHSDADVLIHAICDALLGAANMRDIGFHYADNDPQYKNIDSKILLKNVVNLLRSEGWEIENIDATVCLQRPKLSGHIPNMKAAMAGVMEIPDADISIKATTSEKMGFVGREEGIAAYAVVLISKIK